jgi:hypothetical protein
LYARLAKAVVGKKLPAARKRPVSVPQPALIDMRLDADVAQARGALDLAV